jgi:hypothetical protein
MLLVCCVIPGRMCGFTEEVCVDYVSKPVYALVKEVAENQNIVLRGGGVDSGETHSERRYVVDVARAYCVGPA